MGKMRRDSGVFLLMPRSMKISRFAIFSAVLAAFSCGSVFAQNTVAPMTVSKAKVPDAPTIFSPYIGTWKGETKVMNADQQPLSTLTVEQRYQWGEGGPTSGVLLGEAVYTATNHEGKPVVVTVRSRTEIRGGEIFAELTQGKEKERFSALVDEDGFLVFVPEGTPKGKTPEKLSASRVEKDKEQAVIRVRGFERVTVSGKEGKVQQTVLLVEGKLVKQPEAAR